MSSKANSSVALQIHELQADKSHHSVPGRKFQNPWPSYQQPGFSQIVRMLRDWDRSQPTFALPSVAVEWDRVRDCSLPLQTTWLGHACFLNQLYGVNILLDPVFSKRCSMVQWAGPKRFTPAPCTVADIPQVDIIILSHNHYDHLDYNTIQDMIKLHPQTLYMGPLNLAATLVGFGVPADQITEFDWWDQHRIVKTTSVGEVEVVITCTPAQHGTGRGIFDQHKTLWAGFTAHARRLESTPDTTAAASTTSTDADTVSTNHAGSSPTTGLITRTQDTVSFYFTGDTGYRKVPRGIPIGDPREAEYPHCPAFQQIGDVLGPFDLGLLPIGAYSPRWFMSTVHACPEESVQIHQQVRAARSIGMHWGTFPLTDEPVDEPPKRLAAAVAAAGLDADAFVALNHGETVVLVGEVSTGVAAAVAVEEGVEADVAPTAVVDAVDSGRPSGSDVPIPPQREDGISSQPQPTAL